MAIGFRAYKEFERLAPELVEAFRGIPSSNIGDCTQRMNCMFDGIRPFNGLPLVGTAFTVRVPSGDNHRRRWTMPVPGTSSSLTLRAIPTAVWWAA